MKSILYISSIFLLTSCFLNKRTSEKVIYKDVIKDSVVYRTTTIIDTVFILGDTIVDSVHYKVFKRDTLIVYKSGRATTKLRSRNGLIKVETNCDSLIQLVTSTKKEVFKYRNENQKLITQKQEVIIKKLPWYYKIMFFISIILVFLYVSQLLINKI